MTESDLIKKLATTVGTVPAEAEVLGVRRYSSEDLERRARKLLGVVNAAYNLSTDRGDWTLQKERTVVRLPRGARAVIYHASGAMKVTAGLQPMENMFPVASTPTKDALVTMVEAAAQRLSLSSWVGANQSLKFERLWQIRATGADRAGKVAPTILCRAIGAYRHRIGEIPVLGPASAAVKVGVSGQLDSVTLQIRETTPEVIDRAAVIPPADAARQIVAQVAALMGKGKVPYTEVVTPERMVFGYLNLGKRKTQRVLAPVYLASLSIAGEEAQAYVVVTSATEKPYFSVARGTDAPVAAVSRSAVAVAPAIA